MRELIQQMGAVDSAVKTLLDDPASAILEIDRKVADIHPLRQLSRLRHLAVPLAGS